MYFIATDFETNKLTWQNIADLSVTVPSLSVSVTGLSVSVYGLSVSLPISRTETLKVPDWPGKVTGLSRTFADRSGKVTDSMVCFPAQSVSF